MNEVAALIADLVAAGTPAALVGRVAAALSAPSRDDELSADRRGRDRIRKRLSREKSKSASAERPRTTADIPSPPSSPSPDKETSPLHPPKENNLFPDHPPQPRVSGARAHSVFETRFWPAYPHKVGKRDAEKAWERASSRADVETILAGLDRYVAKTDDRPWCNPATWLNQDRWTDQPARASPQRRMTRAEETGERLRQEIERKYGNGAGREEDGDLPFVAGLLATSREAR